MNSIRLILTATIALGFLCVNSLSCRENGGVADLKDGRDSRVATLGTPTSPVPLLEFRPYDGDTGHRDTSPSIFVDFGEFSLDESVLEQIASNVFFASDEGAVQIKSIDISRGRSEALVTFHPLFESEGWVFFGIASHLDPLFKVASSCGATRHRDGAIGVRFLRSSSPHVASIRYCPKSDDRFVVQIDFSERVAVESSPDESPVVISSDGADGGCALVSHVGVEYSGAASFLCVGTRQPSKLSIVIPTSNVRSVSGVLLKAEESASEVRIDFDLSKVTEHVAGCSYLKVGADWH